jgi:hypothetical protein
MTQDDKVLAEAILEHLCVGRRICGAYFYAVPILVIDVADYVGPEEEAKLTIETEWKIVDKVPAELPVMQFTGSVVPRQRTSELISEVGYLGWHRIVHVQLGDCIPHLLLTFENGRTLLINGHHDLYECWNISRAEFLVVCTPGDGLAIWHPDGFRAGSRKNSM